MKLVVKLLTLFVIGFGTFSCQQNNQLLVSVSPQTTATPTDIKDRDKIDDELKRAVENQDAGKIKELLQKVSEPADLIKAIEENNSQKVNGLLQQGANPNAVEWWAGLNPRYFTALWLAIVKKNTEIVELLLQHGADINKVSASFDSKSKQWNSGTVLDVALLGDYNLEMVEFLVEHGASVKDEKEILFHTNSDEIMRYLLANGADVNEQDNDGHSILTHWYIEPDISNLKRYLEYGANPYLKNKYGKNAFDAVRGDRLLTTEKYAWYNPETKGYVVLNKKLSSDQKRKAIKLMKEYGAKFLEPEKDKGATQ